MNENILNYTQNRELSWLKFNQRVLEEAQDPKVPLLERMKFVAIFTSNLDEFFMIRVGSLYDMVASKMEVQDSRSGMTPQEQLDAIYKEVAPLYKERDKTYAQIKKEMGPYGVCGLDYKELDAKEKKYIKKYFKDQVLPVLSPQIVDANHPFPHFMNKEIYVIADLSQDGKSMLGIVPVPQYISDILYLPCDSIRYIRMEKVIMEHLDMVFDQYTVTNPDYVCVTRNADINPDDENLEIEDDFRYRMKQTLHKRKRMAVVRMETAEKMSPEREEFFCKKFNIGTDQIFRTKMPMKLDYIFAMGGELSRKGQDSLSYAPFSPQNKQYVAGQSMIKQIRQKDMLLFYPYESMEPFLRLIKEASTDPNVLTIKITIYRLAKKARLVEYLCAAAENGKEVTVLIELRARFDEENNILWSERLEEAGCHVLYGFEGYKVHSKLCLITYRNHNEIQYITQVGTGNYNEKTATMYTDLSMMSGNQEIGRDAARFFKNMAVGNLNGSYNTLIVSPSSLKQKVLFLIDEEIKKGSEGRIVMKMNSVTDVDFIEKIAEASRAGVKTDLIVRGICCILPKVPGYTDNVTVTSIVGRYLEHPRIFCFGKGRQQRIYIGSADMMTRNTEKRVEVACPVFDQNLKNKIIHYVDVMLKDNVKARELDSNGIYHKKEQKEPLIDSQACFMEEAINALPAEKEDAKAGFFDKIKRFFKRQE